ncbi:hypothetical protein [Gallibacterium anatis]|uniref:hypothetical protein n=1 Tax=Gallibacterium anatis TaxID=750 RepID=UPI00300527B5
MNYYNGIKIKLGDSVELSKIQGKVVALISEDKYLHKGILVEFNKLGLIYYDEEIEEDVEFIKRQE